MTKLTPSDIDRLLNDEYANLLKTTILDYMIDVAKVQAPPESIVCEDERKLAILMDLLSKLGLMERTTHPNAVTWKRPCFIDPEMPLIDARRQLAGILDKWRTAEAEEQAARLASDIKYIPHTVTNGGIHPENGQGLAGSASCFKFECQAWDGDVKTAPELVENEQGFWTCPKCHGSYGRHVVS